MNALELQLRANGVDLLAEHVDGPLDVRRPVGFAATDLVVDVDWTLVRQSFERPEIVVGRARPAVQREQRYRAGIAIAGDAIPRAIPAEVHITRLDLCHAQPSSQPTFAG